MALVEEVGPELAPETEAVDVLFPDVETLLGPVVTGIVAANRRSRGEEWAWQAIRCRPA